MLCAAIDIGSNTTRVLVAEPQEGQLRKVMEQRAYTRIDKTAKRKGKITAEKIGELADVVGTQVRLAQELGAEAFRIVATAAIREAKNGDDVASEIVFGTVEGGVREVLSFRIGSGTLADEFLTNDPPSPSEIRAVRDAIGDFFEDVEAEHPDHAVAVGGSAASLRTLVGAVLEYETLERAVRVLSSDEIYEVAKRFEL